MTTKLLGLCYSHLPKGILYRTRDVAYRTDCIQHIYKSLNYLLQTIKSDAKIIAYTKRFFLLNLISSSFVCQCQHYIKSPVTTETRVCFHRM